AVFDTGGHDATTSFVEGGIGELLLTFASEANSIAAQNPDCQAVAPKTTPLPESPVTWVGRSGRPNGSEELAKGDLEGLYSEEAQRLIAGFYYRVHDEKVKAEFADRFPELELVAVEQIGGSWENVMKEHFASGGKLDQLQRR